jgi:hypothetical protein
MSGYDQRIATAFVGLGYDLFPFEAFDGAGRVIVPDVVHYPDYIQEGLGVVSQSGIWQELYKTVSVLGNPPWNVFSCGLNFTERAVNVAIFKPIYPVADARAAHQWVLSYQAVPETTISGFAALHHFVDPKWLSLLDDAIDKLPVSLTQEFAGSPSGRTDSPKGAVGKESLVGWLALGLRAMSGVLRAVSVRSAIRTTVFWYPSGQQVIDQAFAAAWIPLHFDYITQPNLRAVNGLWEPGDLPHFFAGREVNWNRAFWAVPNTLSQWCRAFYPTLNCGSGLGPSAVSEGVEVNLAGSGTGG